MAAKQQVKKTTSKPRVKGGNKAMNGTTGKLYSTTNQPTPAAKKAGWAKKKFSRALLTEILNTPYHFKDDSEIKKQLSIAFGFDVNDIPAGTIAILQQVQKSILKGDTNAVRELINQDEGYPKQKTDITTNGKDLPASEKQIIEVSLSI